MTIETIYHKHFIRPNGTFVGDFEGLYRACEDPWQQSIEVFRSPLHKLVAMRIARLPERRVIDMGCGNGHSSELFRTEGNAEVLGLDISPTAISSARSNYPLCRFEVASASEVNMFTDFQPTVLAMCSLTWCILEVFEKVLSSLKEYFPNALLFHILTFYAPGVQKYGTQYFTNLDELLPYFSQITVEQTFVYTRYPRDGTYHSLVIARI